MHQANLPTRIIVSLSACVCAAFAYSAGAAAAPTSYTLTDLGTLSSVHHTVSPQGINERGQVVGRALISPNVYRAFLWTPTVPNGTTGSLIQVVGSTNPNEETLANGINSRGQVVGYRSSTSGDRAFLWSPNIPNGTSGSVVPLGSVPGAEVGSWAQGINDFGQVTGGGLTVPHTDLAFLWTPSIPNGSTGSMQSLGVPQFDSMSIGEAINGFGQVAGHGLSRSFVWTPTSANGTNGTMTVLPPLGEDYQTTFASDINDAGQVVGTSPRSGGRGRAFLWTPSLPNGTAGSMTELGIPPAGATGSAARGINDLGVVVGSADTIEDTFGMRWSADEGMVDLNTLIDPNVAAFWELGSARDINDAGQIIGNGSYDPDGPGGAAPQERAYLLTPLVPEPATAVAMLVVVACTGWRPRARRGRFGGEPAGSRTRPGTMRLASARGFGNAREFYCTFGAAVDCPQSPRALRKSTLITSPHAPASVARRGSSAAWADRRCS
jgi:probable HAF family extracellular repeat protein